jgi:hypothetical protein
MRPVIAIAVAALGCGASPAPEIIPDPSAGPAALRDCRDRPFTPSARERWRHRVTTGLTVAAGAPDHAAADLVVADATALVMRAKLAYGAVSKDLEDERVRVWIDDCTAWRAIGDALTDADGRVAVPVPADLLVAPGMFDTRFEVLGDGSTAAGRIWLLPAGTHVVLADLDGTLTTSDIELFRGIVDEDYMPAAYPGAAELTVAHAARGGVVMYLTGRPYYLASSTRAWLASGGFAAGPVFFTDTPRQALPTRGGVAAFKQARIAELLAQGYAIDAAYGNAATDLVAYIAAGIAADHVWIIGEHAGKDGTHAVTGDWTATAAAVRATPAAAQPFTR